MSVRTLDIEKIESVSGNIYKSIVIMAKRARQIAAKEKMELDEKLKYFEGFEEEEDFTFNEEQERISKEYEKRLHATQRAIDEMEHDDIHYRVAE
jgi:hypothetical protein